MPKSAAPRNFPMARPPLERMMRIHQELQEGKFPNATKLARELEVSTKSIHRDIEFMRDRMNLPIEYVALHNGYHYTEEVSGFPTMQITEGELFALLVAEKALQQYRGTAFEKPLLSAIRKMATSLPDTISLNMAEWEQTISFRTSAEPILDLKIFKQLTQAVADRQQLEIVYRKPGQRQGDTRRIDPYHLANVNGEWFLFAYDHGRQDIRRFVPVRMQSIRPTGKKFARPAKFSVEKHLRDSFGIHSNEGEFNVLLRFDETVADYIREKKWHASQELTELKDGGVELKLKLSSLGEVQRWVLSWSGHATVLQPPELVATVRAAAERLLAAKA